MSDLVAKMIWAIIQIFLVSVVWFYTSKMEKENKRLIDENDRLRSVNYDNKSETEATRIRVAALQAENERLRKAGDAMAALIVDELAFYEDDGNEYEEVKAWNAAKGVQP